MDIERRRLIEIVVSIGAVGLFISLLVGIGFTYNEDGLSADGGLVLVGAILFFVLLMAAVGIGLAYKLDPE